MLREGLVYYNKGEDQKALTLFKTIAKDYPNTNEASQAVASAKLIYVDMGKVSEYASWAKSLGYVEVTDLELEGASYEAAERQYLQNNSKEAIAASRNTSKISLMDYAAPMPSSTWGNSILIADKKPKRLPHYENVSKGGSNEYGEQALTRVCQILLMQVATSKPNLTSKNLRNRYHCTE